MDVIRANPDSFSVEVLVGNSNADLLINQAIEFNPNVVVIADETETRFYVKDTLLPHDIKFYAGANTNWWGGANG